MCAHTDPHEPSLPLSLPLLVFLSLPHLTSNPLFASLFSLLVCALGAALGSGEVGLNVLCPPWRPQLLFAACHSAWGLTLKPKAAREDASDGFWPLFHSPAFIPLCSDWHQGRFLTSMLFRQLCHGHGDVVMSEAKRHRKGGKHRIKTWLNQASASLLQRQQTVISQTAPFGFCNIRSPLSCDEGNQLHIKHIGCIYTVPEAALTSPTGLSTFLLKPCCCLGFLNQEALILGWEGGDEGQEEAGKRKGIKVKHTVLMAYSLTDSQGTVCLLQSKMWFEMVTVRSLSKSWSRANFLQTHCCRELKPFDSKA